MNVQNCPVWLTDAPKVKVQVIEELDLLCDSLQVRVSS